jgi:hypothetical protein
MLFWLWNKTMTLAYRYDLEKPLDKQLARMATEEDLTKRHAQMATQ